MRDFLDNLIDRHADVAPQIKPRLPSIFEPEVSHGGLDVAAPDNNAPAIEETDILPSRQVTIPPLPPQSSSQCSQKPREPQLSLLGKRNLPVRQLRTSLYFPSSPGRG